jgi:transposase
MTERKTVKPFPAEVRGRAVRMLREHRHEHVSEWAALQSIAGKIGCTAETLRGWIRQAERDEGVRPGLTADSGERDQLVRSKVITDSGDHDHLGIRLGGRRDEDTRIAATGSCRGCIGTQR